MLSAWRIQWVGIAATGSSGRWQTVPISSVTSLQLFQERRNTSNDQVGQKCTMLVLADSRDLMQLFTRLCLHLTHLWPVSQ